MSKKMDERRNGIVSMYESTEANDNPKKTFVCLGVPRGGTSAVAGTMLRLGLNMGDNLPDNYEDQDFVGRSVQHMKTAVEDRKSRLDIWGWKCPEAANYLDRLLPELENPHLVIVYRDVVATMKGHIRWHSRGELQAAHEVLLAQQKNWFLMDRWKLPTALVSYEKAMVYPRIFIHSMSRFLSVAAPQTTELEDMVKFLEPGSYK